MKVFKGILVLEDTVKMLVSSLWIFIGSLGACLSAFGFLHIKWVILFILLPIMLIAVVLVSITGVLLVLGLTGRIPSDIDQYKTEPKLEGN